MQLSLIGCAFFGIPSNVLCSQFFNKLKYKIFSWNCLSSCLLIQNSSIQCDNVQYIAPHSNWPPSWSRVGWILSDHLVDYIYTNLIFVIKQDNVWFVFCWIIDGRGVVDCWEKAHTFLYLTLIIYKQTVMLVIIVECWLICPPFTGAVMAFVIPLLFALTVPTTIVARASNFSAKATLVKKLSVVMLYRLDFTGETSHSTTSWAKGTPCLLSFSCAPKYGRRLTTYLLSTSTKIQNFIPNLSGLFGMYTMNGQQFFIGISFSSTVRLNVGVYFVAQLYENFSKIFLMCVNLSVSSRPLLVDLSSNLRKRKIDLNVFRGIVSRKIFGPYISFHRSPKSVLFHKYPLHIADL